MLIQVPEFSFNEEDDMDGNGEPRPAHGDLYETLMYLMNPDPAGRPLGLLWYSPFASLMLVIQIQMMTRELVLASTFLYNNVRCHDLRHNLSIITEGNRAPIMQALNSLADLIPKPDSAAWSMVVGGGGGSGGGGGCDPAAGANAGAALWHPVWMAWHYTAISLTHQDALLTSGIVEYSVPTAISTAWELGKPRAKAHRDIYEDRDIIRVADHLEHVIRMLAAPPTGSVSIQEAAAAAAAAAASNVNMGSANGGGGTSGGTGISCIEDPFVTMLGFKACMMGWRVVRLMALGLEQPLIPGSDMARMAGPNICSISAQVVLTKVLGALSKGDGSGGGGSLLGFEKGQYPDVYHSQLGSISAVEAKYLEWTERTFAVRDIWQPGEWIVAVFNEPREGAG